MHNLKKQAFAIVHGTAVLGLLIVLSASAARSQTYSSPVRVTNTPLPTVSNEQYYAETHKFGPMVTSEVTVTFSPATNVLVESASVDCTVPLGQRVVATVSTVPVTIATVIPHAIPLQYQGNFDGNDRYTGLVPLKAYHKTIQNAFTVSMSVNLTKNSNAGNISCTSALEGTVKP